MAIEPSMQPDGGGEVAGSAGPRYSGTGRGGYDSTVEPGQYPPGMAYEREMFGGILPTGTGAGGTAPAPFGGDPTLEPGQVSERLSGVGPPQTTSTGAPGMATTPNGTGGAESISYTRPGSPYSGTYKSDTINDDTSGPRDSTQANDTGYATGGPQLPGIKGNEPAAGDGRYQPGSGRVLRGGRAVRP